MKMPSRTKAYNKGQGHIMSLCATDDTVLTIHLVTVNTKHNLSSKSS